MTNNKKIDLFEHALSINGELDPVTIAVGDVDITLRRNHTGQQIAQWDQIETDILTKNRKVLADESLNVDEKNRKVRANQKSYIADLLGALTTEDTSDDVIKTAVDSIAKLPAESRSRVIQTVAILAGVISEDGKSIPFGSSSKTKKSTGN